MSTPLDFYGFYDAQPSGGRVSYNEDQYRFVASFASLTDGVKRVTGDEFAVVPGSGRAVTVTAGTQGVLSGGGIGIGAQAGYLLADTDVAIAANTAANPRIDSVVVRNNFAANVMELDVVQGTPAASPAPPTLADSTSVKEHLLANVAVAAGFSSFVSGNITDCRQWAQGLPAGRALLLAAKALRTTNLAVAHNTNTAVQFDSSESYDSGGIHSLGTNPSRFTVPGGCRHNLVSVVPMVEFESAVTGTIAMFLYKNGSNFKPLFHINGQAAGTSKVMRAVYEGEAEPGDYFEVYVFQNGTGSTQNIIGAECSLRVLGPIEAAAA